ncbi:MAG TPA: hypothetical protein VH186_30390 [Chloroflexia bacterium]|nr:hypothetical protein [Chloroflexia bacterium]
MSNRPSEQLSAGSYPRPAATIPARRRGVPWWGWLIVVGVIASIAACIVLFPIVAKEGISAKDDAAAVVDRYIKAAITHNVDEMYSLSDNIGDNSRDKASFQNSIETTFFKPNAAFLANYQSLSAGPYFSMRTSNDNRTSLDISGNVIYKDQSKGSFSATLMRDGDSWKVVKVKLDPPRSE